MILPSLILRLEPLPPRPEAAVDAPATDALASDAAPNHSGAVTPRAVAEQPEQPEQPARRRTVEVAATERLGTATPLNRWSAAVAAAHDACFVLDASGSLVSISVSGVDLLGCGDTAVIGRHILDVVSLVDLETGALHPVYEDRIPPLSVLQNPGLARSIMRLRHSDNTVVTLDSSSAPIHDVTGHLLGSVTFLAPIPPR